MHIFQHKQVWSNCILHSCHVLTKSASFQEQKMTLKKLYCKMGESDSKQQFFVHLLLWYWNKKISMFISQPWQWYINVYYDLVCNYSYYFFYCWSVSPPQLGWNWSPLYLVCRNRVRLQWRDSSHCFDCFKYVAVFETKYYNC